VNQNDSIHAGENTQAVPILMYHSISERAEARRAFRNFTISPNLFAAHLNYLSQPGYTGLTVTRFARSVRARLPLPPRPIVITFDDGFADFFSSALPILQRHGFPATLYITASYIGGTSLWLRHEGETTRPMLIWDQVHEINAAGIECGAHSLSHAPLDTLAAEAASVEIANCKNVLQENLSTEVESFAYPFGYYTLATQRFVRQAGYTSACAVKHAFSSTDDDLFALARLHVTAGAGINRFAALLTQQHKPMRTAFLKTRTTVWQIIRRCAARIREGAS
jgi:peptidoglycan/xylan/chitin deacetylase (PgdA/CDA1 family)